MNSAEGSRGFITFLVLLGVLFTIFLAFNYVSKTQSVSTKSIPRVSGVKSFTSEFREDDSSGITTEPPPMFEKLLGNHDEKEKGLGDNINIANEMNIVQFKEALLFNDTRYDFDKDGQVTNADYPLFIEFIINKED